MFGSIKEEKISPPNTTEFIIESNNLNENDINLENNFDNEQHRNLSNDNNQPIFKSSNQSLFGPIEREQEPSTSIKIDRNRNICLINLIKNSIRTYAGLEYIIEFQSRNEDGSEPRYYCELCQCGFEYREILKHCTHFIHIFRYIKKFLPEEYKRILNRQNIESRIELVKKIIKFYQNRTQAKHPKLILLNNLSEDYFNFIYDLSYNIEVINVEDSEILDRLNEREQFDCEKNNNYNGESLLANVKRCNSPPLQQIISVNNETDNNNREKEFNDLHAQNTNTLSNIRIKNEPISFDEYLHNSEKLKRKADDVIKTNDSPPDIKRSKFDYELKLINDIIYKVLNNIPCKELIRSDTIDQIQFFYKNDKLNISDIEFDNIFEKIMLMTDDDEN